jgi:uncharacterized membrane protein
MVEDDEDGARGADLGRTLALSDGIFAIAMTLLAFQIQPPTGPGRALAHELGKRAGQYYVFALSFSVIGLFWLAHHRLFRQVRRTDEMLMSLNLLFLMLVAALPFPSAVLARYGGQRVAVILYASAMATAGFLMMVLTVVAQRRRLLAPAATATAIRRSLWRAGSAAGVFVVSIPVAIASPSVATYTWVAVVPLRLLPRIRRTRSPQLDHEG